MFQWGKGKTALPKHHDYGPLLRNAAQGAKFSNNRAHFFQCCPPVRSQFASGTYLRLIPFIRGGYCYKHLPYSDSGSYLEAAPTVMVRFTRGSDFQHIEHQSCLLALHPVEVLWLLLRRALPADGTAIQ
jgi:hypothetical protein